MGGWVALEKWKVRLTQPPTKLSLAMPLTAFKLGMGDEIWTKKEFFH